MGVLLGEPFRRLKNHLVQGLIAGINECSVHSGAPGEGALGSTKGGAFEAGLPGLGSDHQRQEALDNTSQGQERD